MEYKDLYNEVVFDDNIKDDDEEDVCVSYELSDLDKFLTDELIDFDGESPFENTLKDDTVADSEPPKKGGVKITSVHKGHRERVMQKFIKHGFSAFTDYEVLEFVLFYAIPYKDTNVIAHRLIERFGSIKAVMEAEHYELSLVKGIGDRAAALIVMLRELHKYISTSHYTNDILYTSDITGEYCMNYFKNHVKENFILISIDTDKKVKCIDVISKGTETETAFYARDIVRAIIKNRVANVIMAHNHPGNNPEPSTNDIAITEKMGILLKGLGVTLVDHVICSGNKFISFSEKGYLKN